MARPCGRPAAALARRTAAPAAGRHVRLLRRTRRVACARGHHAPLPDRPRPQRLAADAPGRRRRSSSSRRTAIRCTRRKSCSFSSKLTCATGHSSPWPSYGRRGVEDPTTPAPDPAAHSEFEELRSRLRHQLHEIERHDPGTRLGRDPESLHDMRVARPPPARAPAGREKARRHRHPRARCAAEGARRRARRGSRPGRPPRAPRG